MTALPTKDDGEFGKVIVYGDHEGDLKAIVDNLNPLQWEQWAVKGVRAGGARRDIIVSKGDYGGTLRPIGDIFVLSDGRRCFASDADQSFIEQWEAEEGEPGVFDWDRCTLGELSALISPHLNKGAIEFVEVRTAGGMIDHERLLVRSDGSAEYHNCRFLTKGTITRIDLLALNNRSST